MGTNLQNNLIVQFQWDVTTASTTVAISTDLERWQVVTASGCYCTIRNKNGSKIERVKGDAAAWTFTFTKRWLDQSDSDVEVSGLKKEWRTGQTMYITLLSSQIVDKQNSNTYGTGSTQTFDSLEFTSTSKGRVFADLAALNVAYPTPINGLVDMYCTAEGQYFDSAGWSWVARASWVNPNASETVAGKIELATAAQRWTATSVWETGARLVPSNDALVKTSSWASDENKIPVLDATGKLAQWFLPEDAILYYWNGQDGAVVISSNTSLTRDMFYTDLTVNNWFTLNPAWYRIHVSGTLTLNGSISRNGSVWGNASWGAAGTGWTSLANWTLGTNQAWTNGWAGVGLWWGNGWGAQSALSNTFSALTGATGWNGWIANAMAWGTGWATVTPTRWLLYNYTIPKFQSFSTLWYTNIWLYNSNVWGAGWWSGGDQSWGTSWGWGWGASTGGIIQIFARIINISATWQINSNWGLWGNWADGSAWGWGWQVSWWGGGWWWGNGWTIVLVFDTFTNLGTITVTWWAGGNWWNASRSWGAIDVAGWNGGNGWNGGIVYFSKSVTPWTVTVTWWTGGTKWTDIWSPSPASANGSNGSSGSTITAI